MSSQEPSEGRPTVRPATAADLPGITQLWEKVSLRLEKSQPLFARQSDAIKRYQGGLETALDDPDHLLAVVAADTGILGFVYARIAPRSPIAEPSMIGRIEDCIVRPELDSDAAAKASRRLVSEAVNWFARVGIELIEIHVPADESTEPLTELGFHLAYYRLRANTAELDASVFEVGLHPLPTVYPGTDAPVSARVDPASP